MRISDWSSDVCSADLQQVGYIVAAIERDLERLADQPVIGEDDIREFEHKNSLVALGAAIRPLSKLPVERDVHAFRSDARRVGEECVSTCRSGWPPSHSKKNNNDI